MSVKSLEEINLEGKRVLLRVDYNTPMKDGAVSDDSRIVKSLPTVRYLMEKGANITFLSHMGRPKGKVVPEFSLKPVAECLSNHLGKPVPLFDSPDQYRPDAPLQMFENLRFHPGETSNDAAFAQMLAQFGEVYINDAFGAAHRAHASIAAVCTHFQEKGAGLLMAKELHYLQNSLKDPKRPFLVILGGAKVSDKLAIITNLLPRVNSLIIGGAMSYTFLKAKGHAVGTSRVEEDFLEEAREIVSVCETQGIRLLLPLDHLVADQFDEDAEATITLDCDIPDGKMGLDIGPETINLYCSVIHESQTLVWNGPMGVFEWEAFSTGTLSVAEAVAQSEALTIVGGGDSVAAIKKADVADRITHISTGGGASLELLGGAKLPGVTALES